MVEIMKLNQPFNVELKGFSIIKWDDNKDANMTEDSLNSDCHSWIECRCNCVCDCDD